MKYLSTVACTLFFLPALSFAQLFPSVSYPRDFFRDPLNIPIHLAANFGELRAGHYHMGLDIRTQQKENLPVFAAADGFVTRVVIEPAGFGQAIYIRHPNGFTTLYAHLNRFFPALAAYVHEQQYRLESWQVSLDIPPGLFPVKKGDTIALSGNTGGSQGPHLHFEIRRTDGDVNCNPLLFGLPVPDNKPPTLLRLAYYDRSQGIYEQTPVILPVHAPAATRSPSRRATTTHSASPASAAHPASATGPSSAASPAVAAYSIAPSLITVPFPRISFAISAFDAQTGSSNPNGIFQTILYEEERPVIGFRMDNISYEHTRNINAHIDYRTRETGGPWLQHLSMLPGYPPPSIYRSPAGDPAASATPAGAGKAADGVIDLSDGRPHAIRIEVKDPTGNTAELKYHVQYRPPMVARVPLVPSGKEFYPGMVDGQEKDDCAFYLGEKSLYDSVHIDDVVSGYPGSGISLPGGISAVHAIGAPWIPLLDPLLVRLRPAHPVHVVDLMHPDSAGRRLDTGKVVMVCFGSGIKEVQRPQWQGGWASARFHEFGKFQLVEDKEPPVITLAGIRDGAVLTHVPRISFTVKENLGALRRVRAELDPSAGGPGQWLCFTNDKGRAFIYTFDEHCPPGQHVLRVTAEDVAGNRTVEEYHFTR